MAGRVLPTQADVTRAVKGARAGGLDVGRVEIEPGKIVVYAATAVPEPATAFDGWKAKRDARPA